VNPDASIFASDGHLEVTDKSNNSSTLSLTMTKLSISSAAFFCVLLLSGGARGQIVVCGLPKLVRSSDVVAVAQVVGVTQTGSGAIEFPPSHPILARFRVANLHLRDVLKGTPASADITVPYTVLYSPAGWAGGIPWGYTIRDSLTPNSIRLIFLKSVGARYEFTNGSYLSVVCAPEAPSSRQLLDPLDRVLSRITAALFSTSVPRQEKAEAIWQLGAVEEDSVVAALRTFLRGDVAAKDESLRIDVLTALVGGHKDMSVVEAAESELLSGSTSYSKCNLVYSFAAVVPRSCSFPILTRLLDSASPEIRTCAGAAADQAARFSALHER